MSDNDHDRIIKLELCYERLSKELESIDRKVDDNSTKLVAILTNTESLDKIIKYVVTPLIVILGGLVGIQVSTG